MKKYFLFLLMLISLSTYKLKAQSFVSSTSVDKLVTERFEYVRTIKKHIGSIFWKDFGINDFEGTIVYFKDSASYFINPLPEMKEKVSKYAVLENDYNWNIWKLKLPFDTAFFVMETTFQYDKRAKWDINYNTPVLFSSSPELTYKEKTHINSTEEWSVALMHELFHQYQYNNPSILAYVLRLYEEKKMIDMDSLQSIYLINKMVNDTIKMENELLKNAFNATSLEEEKKLYKQFLKLRGLRNLAYLKKKKFMLTTPEDFWEKLEGSCLMMEEKLKQEIVKIPVPDYIKSNDPMYKNGIEFASNNLENYKNYIELNDSSFYVGTTGYNMIRLLEKNNVNYKDNYFKYASLPLSLQLKYFYKL